MKNIYGISRMMSLALILFLLAGQALPGAAEENAAALLKGKHSLESGNFDAAIKQLTEALVNVPLLTDYALLWRAKAYEGADDHENALTDLRTIKGKYRETPLYKKARSMELEIMEKTGAAQLEKTYAEFSREYPSDLEVKLRYAKFLKINGRSDDAVRLFKDIYVTASHLSNNALNELSDRDISQDDLMKRCENLSKAWFFTDSEKCFREVLRKDTGKRLRNDALQGLAGSLFHQKKYAESAKIYKDLNNRFWRVRAMFRAGDFDTLRDELSNLKSGDDHRIAAILIAYGTKKRRDGDIEGAINIYDEAMSRFPSAREDALWAKGWAYQLLGDYKKSADIFGRLKSVNGDGKYIYWKKRADELAGDNGSYSERLSKYSNGHRDFYSYLTLIRSKGRPDFVEKMPLRVSMSSSESERIDLLAGLGLKEEAGLELIALSRKNPDTSMLIYISAYLKKLGNYKTSVSVISKVPYSSEYHELFYPLAYRNELEEASRENGIDPLLVLSVMREESRYATDARSIAGAMGLMQLMPQTAGRLNKHVKINYRHTAELYNARINILLGSYYLKSLIDRFGPLPYAIAAYNAGEDAVRDWLKTGRYRTVDEFIEDIPYDETRNYVKKVLTTYFEYLRSGDNMNLEKVYGSIGKL